MRLRHSQNWRVRGGLGGVIYRDVYWKSVDTVKDVEEVEKVISEVYA